MIQTIKRIEVGEHPTSMIDAYKGFLVVVGTAWCMEEDFQKAKGLLGTNEYDVMVLNLAIIAFHKRDIRLKHWATLHEEFFAIRQYFTLKHDVVTHGHRPKPNVNCLWRIPNIGGTSAHFATYLGLLMGYEKIILCGCPLDNKGHFYDEKKDSGCCFDDKGIQMTWQQTKQDKLGDSVRSFSGFTKEILGEPNGGWINGK